MTTAEIESLLERVRKATGPDRRIDEAIDAFLYRSGMNHYGDYDVLPMFTASVDSCLALIERVLPGLVIDAVKVGDGSGRWQVREAWISDMDGAVVDPFSPPDPRPGPLAFLEALLLALLHQASDKGMIDAE